MSEKMIISVKAIERFFKIIEHGDFAHREWLRKCFNEYFKIEIPQPEGTPMEVTDTEERRKSLMVLRSKYCFLETFSDEGLEALWEAYSDQVYSAGFIAIDDWEVVKFRTWLFREPLQ